MSGSAAENGSVAAGICGREAGEVVLPASAIQRQIVAHEAMIEGAPAYNVLAGAELHGPVDAERLAVAFSLLVDAHAALRARMTITGEGLAQAIAAPGRSRSELEVHEVAAGEALARAGEFARRPLDVFSEPPVRLGLFVEHSPRGSPERAVLALVLHHAFGDGHSLVAICNELGANYAAADGRSGGLGRAAPHDEALEDYRRQILAAEETAVGEAARGEAGAPAFRSGRGEIRIELLGRRRTELLRERGRAARVTPFSVALAAFALVLRPRFGGEAVELSVPVTTRTERAAFDLVGPLMRMARVRLQLSSSQVGTLLAEVQEAVLGGTFSGSAPAGDGKTFELEHGLAFAADIEPAQHLALPGVTVVPLVLHPATAVFGLTGTLETIRGGELRLRLEVAEETMSGAEAQALLDDVLAAIDGLVESGLEQAVAA